MDGFKGFYADSYPLILHDKDANNFPMQTHLSPSNFASFLDVYYGDKCILSSVLDGIPGAADIGEDDETTALMRGLSNYVFKLVLLDVDHDEGRTGDGNELRSAIDEYGSSQILAPTFTSHEQMEKPADDSNELVESLRLSWVLLDKNVGRAVNLSSWKPLLAKKIWASGCDYVLHFGYIVPADETILPRKLAKYLMLAGCNMVEKEGYLKWKISMHVGDTKGAYINGGKSLMIMNQALYCLRTNNHHVVDKGYRQLEGRKQRVDKEKEAQRNIADWLCLSIEVAIFITFGYYMFLPI